MLPPIEHMMIIQFKNTYSSDIIEHIYLSLDELLLKYGTIKYLFKLVIKGFYLFNKLKHKSPKISKRIDIAIMTEYFALLNSI